MKATTVDTDKKPKRSFTAARFNSGAWRAQWRGDRISVVRHQLALSASCVAAAGEGGLNTVLEEFSVQSGK